VTEAELREPLVRFGRRQSRGVLLGFSAARLIAIGVGVASVVVATFSFGSVGLAIAVPFWAGAFALAFVRWNGEAVADCLPNVTHWVLRRTTQQVRFRAQISTPRPAGTLALPGDAAALRFHIHEAMQAAMIHDPHRRTLSAIARISHPAYVLLSADDQTRRVAAWSRVLASLSATGSCAGLQVLESTLPDPGHGVSEWWTSRGVHDGSWAAEQYQELVEHAAPTSYTHRTLLVLSLDLKRASRQIRERGRGIGAAAEVLRGDMTTCATALRAAELGVDGWLGANDLAQVIRQAYDPTADGSPIPTALDVAGPVAVDERGIISTTTLHTRQCCGSASGHESMSRLISCTPLSFFRTSGSRFLSLPSR
jgi:hypothetical protein